MGKQVSWGTLAASDGRVLAEGIEQMTMTSIEQVRWLAEVGIDHAALVGQKAATLAILKRAGFPVPDGVVLTTEALAHALRAAGLNDRATQADIEALRLPDELTLALAIAVDRLHSDRLAVRSSGMDEDLPDASYAGQYETVLNVPAADVADAVRRCWASAFSDQINTYRRGHKGARQVALAVLIQPMVEADVAGVAFSADPITGDRNTCVIDAVRGLGDRLVSGHASPDHWQVRGMQAHCQSAPEGAIDAEVALEVAQLVRRVAAQQQAPQDIEWARAGSEVMLLQARPITALPEQPIESVPVSRDVPQGYWQREASHAPRPWTPMSLSVAFGDPRNRAFRRLFAEFGLLAETYEARQIGGWEYSRLVPLGGKDRAAPPKFLMPLLIRLVPAMRRRIASSVAAIRTDKPCNLIKQWYEEWQPELISRMVQLRDADLSGMDEPELAADAERALELLRRGIDIHFTLHGALMPILAELAFACHELLGWSDQEALELLAGLSSTSTQPAHRLAQLAQQAAARPAVSRQLVTVDQDTVTRLALAGPEFAAAFDDYQREFSCRALRYEIAEPSLAETPELTLRLLADQVARGYDPDAEAVALARRRNDAIERARAVLAQRSPAEGERFERALARAERAYPVREDNEFLTASVPLALMRYRLLEIGRRLVDRAQLNRPADIFFLTWEEARSALLEGNDRRALAMRRRGELAYIEQHPGPASYGKEPGPPPSFDALPAEARLMMKALVWYMDRVLEAGPSNRQQQGDSDVLTGIPASPGRYTGQVRLIKDESEFDRLQPGDVLVCPITSPVWSVLFPSIGALVTDTGGVLSHPAIIAREYRVPAVVATGNATELLRDGQLVTIDGSRGSIHLRS
jgi:rifampicin phosphotransferase